MNPILTSLRKALIKGQSCFFNLGDILFKASRGIEYFL